MRNKSLLLFCIVMDIIGTTSYFTGEWFDVVWAPFSSFILYRVFRNNAGKVAAGMNFIEEIMPFVDIIPTFTLTYLYEKYISKKTR